MRRAWIGVGFLVVLLVLGVFVMKLMDRQLGEISTTLERATQVQSWGNAVELAQEAKQEWQSRKKLITALTDHNAVDGIEELFARLEVCQQYRESIEHSAICAQLSKAVHALGENHRLAWYNLL